MIVKMKKVFVVARSGDRDRLVESLRDLGVVHLSPVDPERAVADEETVSRIDRLGRAIQVLAQVQQVGQPPDVPVDEAVEEVLRIQRDSIERRARLSTLARQLRELETWGDVRLEQFEQLQEAGLDVKFFTIAADGVGEIEADCVQPLAVLASRRALVAVVMREGEAKLPEDCQPMPRPQRDRPSVRAEAAEIDAALKKDTSRLGQLAGLVGAMQAEHRRIEHHAELVVASRGGMADEHLYAMQGWAPVDKAETLASDLTDEELDVAVETREPTEDESPPTLIQYPKWTRPIKGLFDILGTLPGYREIDLAPFFVVAFPIFAAMLIGDAGYGLIFLLLGLLFRKKLLAKAGRAKTQLLILLGAVTVLWGVLTANYFGVTPKTVAEAGGFVKQTERYTEIDAMKDGSGGWASVGKTMIAVAPLWKEDDKENRKLLMQICFVFGAVHLILAHLRQAVAFAPNLRFLSEVGWMSFLAGMLGVIWQLIIIKKTAGPWNPIIFVLLIVGAVLAIGFTHHGQRSLGKRIGLGVASFLLPSLASFGDTMSYIRLMAVGLASYYIADAFNDLGATVALTATWAIGALVLLFGHALNIGLAIIAIFAHGVRLNMLEFSSNAGVQWAGHAYAPFANADMKESR